MGESFIDLHDSDILQMEKVLKLLRKRQGENVPLESFRKEVVDRFAEIGFKVSVQVFETNVPGVYAFDFDITDRLEGEFDPNQQAWEATHDVLELGEGGVIKTDGGLHIVDGKGHGHKH